jgi:excisionase family DNA binding protein
MTRRTTLRSRHEVPPPADGGQRRSPAAGLARSTNAESSTSPRTVTVEVAAQLLGISRSLAYLCVHNGQLRAVRLGARIVVPVAAIDELLELRAASAT